MVKILHFADAHIDMANYGRHDPESGLPMRVMDFLKSLDEIVQAAIDAQVDLVIFAGDAYKDRSPAPTYQREWGKRIMQLSRAGIQTLLLTGNHDISPATGRAHAIQEFETLDVPYVKVLDKPQFLSTDDLGGLPIQVIALPWISRSGMVAALEIDSTDPSETYKILGEQISELIENWLLEADPTLPVIFTAHASVEGAQYGSERMVMLGNDMVLPPALVKDKRLDYVALGHIHKPQNLNEHSHPPIIYPGSIERVDFGEAGDKKYYIIAEVSKGKTEVEWRELKNIRPFIDIHINLESDQGINQKLQDALPPEGKLKDAIVRMVVEYQRDWESLIDEAALRTLTASTFEFHFVKRPLMQARVRLPEGRAASSLDVMELLDIYWDASSQDMDREKKEKLNQLARSIIDDVRSGD
ncbi:MAG: exonuclease SbcCD subunit D [Brevefilum sp.]|nr:exonuclease SbcCD subunit D [Brevefilum sp.]MDT8381294.1 exonuclease SbcCD subunit D [Brevefilum sp.]